MSESTAVNGRPWQKLAKKKATEIASGSPLLVWQLENRTSRNHSQGSFES